MDSLAKCPFCGGEAHVFHVGDWWVEHACKNLKKYIGTRFCDTEEEAVAWWNIRAERTCEEYGSVRVWQSCNVWSHELSCGHEVDTFDCEPPNYCPNCGAKVIGG